MGGAVQVRATRVWWNATVWGELFWPVTQHMCTHRREAKGSTLEFRMLTTWAGNSRASWAVPRILCWIPIEAERLPIAASVLGLSKKLFLKRSVAGVKRPTNSISTTAAVHWRPIHVRDPAVVRAGDRAPDARGQDFAVQPRRLFEMFRGVHWTLLSFGGAQDDALAADFACGGHRSSAWFECWVNRKMPERTISWTCMDTPARITTCIRNALVLVRPDGYVGYFSEPESWPES